VDQQIELATRGPIRKRLNHDLGHEEPTVFDDQPVEPSAAKPDRALRAADADRETRSRMHRFLHMDALSSAVALHITCELQFD